MMNNQGLQQKLALVQNFWKLNSKKIIRLAIILMVVITVIWLGYQFWRLLFQPEPKGAIDLRQRYFNVERWFAGEPIYETRGEAVYPPASYLMLWPFMGWLGGETPTRFFFALTIILWLVWLVKLTIRESGVSNSLAKYFVLLIPLSTYATGATIGNGQLIIHILPCLIAGILLLAEKRLKWHHEILGVFLFLFSLIKPTVSAPFFWIVLFVPRRLRPALLVIFGYILLTLIACSFQDENSITLMQQWLTRARYGVEYGAQTFGTSSVSTWLSRVEDPSGGSSGVSIWSLKLNFYAANMFISLLVLGISGIWTYFHRKIDVWLLLGVLGFVARFWTYHGWYDDLLILLPLITLFRLCQKNSSTFKVGITGCLLFLIIFFGLAPGGIYILPSPWNIWYETLQTLIWTITLFFLLYESWQARISQTIRHQSKLS